MIAWNGLYLELCSEMRPNRLRIIGVVRDDRGSDKSNCAVIEMRTIASQRPVSMLTRALHGRCMSCAGRYLAGRAPVVISRDIQPARGGTDNIRKSIAQRQFAYGGCALVSQSCAEADA